MKIETTDSVDEPHYGLANTLKTKLESPYLNELNAGAEIVIGNDYKGQDLDIHSGLNIELKTQRRIPLLSKKRKLLTIGDGFAGTALGKKILQIRIFEKTAESTVVEALEEYTKEHEITEVDMERKYPLA